MQDRFPVTLATKFLDKEKIAYVPRLYNYKKSGAVSAAELMGVEPHLIVKTIVMEDDEGVPFIVLMHGDKEVSIKKMTRLLEVKSVIPCRRRDAQRHTGYVIGGISPFGTRRHLKVYLEETVLDLSKIFINAGRRGFVVEIHPQVLVEVLKAVPVNVAR